MNSQIVVLSFMVVTAAVSHWERSELKAEAPANAVPWEQCYYVKFVEKSKKDKKLGSQKTSRFKKNNE